MEVLEKPIEATQDKIVKGNGEDLATYLQNRNTNVPENGKDVNNSPVQTTNTEVKNDYADILKKEFGDEYDTFDKVKQRLGSKVEVDPELTKLLPDLQFVKSNPQAFQLAKLAAEGGDVSTYWKVSNTDITNLKPIEALKLRYVLEHGMDEISAEKGIKSVYKLHTPDELEAMGLSDYNEAEKAAAQLQFAIDTKQATVYLKEFQEKAKIPPQEQQRLAAEEATKKEKQKVAESWNGEFDKLATSLNIGVKNEVAYRDEKVPLDFNYTFTPEQQTQYKELLKNLVGDGSTKLSPANIAWVERLGKSLMFYDNLDGIAKALQKNVLDAVDVVIGKKFFNIPDTKTYQQPDNNLKRDTITVHKSEGNEQKPQHFGGVRKD